MYKIGYKDLQLKIEQSFLTKIEKELSNFFHDNSYKSTERYNDNKLFYSLRKNAVEIGEHYAVKVIIKRIQNKLNVKTDIKIFLYQDTIFNVTCFPIENYKKIELQIFVSQHFFNILGEDEQVAIIGHEIAHYLFGHLKYSVCDLINYPFNINTVGELKSNLMYWSKVKEITADIIGLVSNDYNFKAYSTALIKHVTGLDESSNSISSISPLIELVLNQYESFAHDPYFNDLHSTHPLMPLRVKVINSVVNTKLLKNFGNNVTKKELTEYKIEFNHKINNIIKEVYPEIFPNENNIDEVLIPMSAAVILADGKIDEREIDSIKSLIKKSYREFEEYASLIFDKKQIGGFHKTIEFLVSKAINIAKKNDFNKQLIIPVIRKLILVAASDNDIDITELNTIYKFAKEFGITKKDIILLIKTQY